MPREDTAAAHAGDPLAHLQYTPAGYAEALKVLHQLSHELCSGRLLLLGGGGYLASNISRVFAREALQLTGRPEPSKEEPLPEPWREQYLSLMGDEAPRMWGEIPPVYPSPWREEKEERLVEQLSRQLGKSFP